MVLMPLIVGRLPFSFSQQKSKVKPNLRLPQEVFRSSQGMPMAECLWRFRQPDSAFSFGALQVFGESVPIRNAVQQTTKIY